MPAFYQCDGCKNLKTDPNEMRLVQGNVLVPPGKGGGGLIGQNICKGDIEHWEKQRTFKVARSDDKSLRIYGLQYCFECFKKACGITEDGKNKYVKEKLKKGDLCPDCKSTLTETADGEVQCLLF